MGLSGIAYSQTNDADLGEKNDCLDADRLTEDQVREFLSNEALSDRYKEAYLFAYIKCSYESCTWSHRFQQIICDDNLPGPSTTPRPNIADCNDPDECP